MQSSDLSETVCFGPFVLDTGARALLAGGERLALSSRAFDILALLVTQRDRVVSKDEILAKVWRGVAVEENNLAVQMSALRRVLAEHAEGQTVILTVPGQGYRFVARLEPPGSAPAPVFAVPVEVPRPPAPPDAPARPASRRVYAACTLAVCVGLLWFFWQRMAGAPPARLSIAVLPFRDLSDDRGQAHLADVITDDLGTALSHLPGAVLTPRGTIEGLKLADAPPEQIGRALHVRYLVAGSLRRSDGKLHVNAHLIDAQTGIDLPSAAPFDVPTSPIEDAQFAIVARTSNALKVKLDAVESARSLQERPNDPDAWDLYFRAAAILDRSNLLADLEPAQKMLEQSIAKAPGFVHAMTELSQVLYAKNRLNDDPNEAKDYLEAKRLVADALHLEPFDDTALAAQGQLRIFERNIEGAEASFKEALRENPFNVLAYEGLASTAWNLGEWNEAISAVNKLLLLDPQKWHGRRGKPFFMIGRWQDAISELESSLAADYGAAGGRFSPLEFDNLFLMAAYDRAGNDLQAQKHYQEYVRRWPHRSIWRLSSYFRKAQVAQPGFQSLRDALSHLGMPTYAGPEFSDLDADAAIRLGKDGDLDPAPSGIGGHQCVGIEQLLTLLRARPPIRAILYVDKGVATLSAPPVPTLWVGESSVLDMLTKIPITGGDVIVIGGGWTGWNAYKAVREIMNSGIKDVTWLCGGEEALAEHRADVQAMGYKLEDTRNP